jgi:pSer/pThr/pTyr-binding forkhead associated (FHA) protein
MNGVLVPLTGGDPIPLVKRSVVIGRRPDCDIFLDAPNVSVEHCQFRFDRGSWVVIDLNSTNGVKVNGIKVRKKRLMPGDEIAIARRHRFRIQFQPESTEVQPVEEPEEVERDESVFAKSLLERAGLDKTSRQVVYDPEMFGDEEQPEETQDYVIDPKTGRKRWKIRGD